jgi:hypothetical protein
MTDTTTEKMIEQRILARTLQDIHHRASLGVSAPSRTFNALSLVFLSKHIKRLEERANPPCGVCLGQPLASGKRCVCDGGGTQDAELEGFRALVFDMDERDNRVLKILHQLLDSHALPDDVAVTITQVITELETPT